MNRSPESSGSDEYVAAKLSRITSKSHHTGNDPCGPTGRTMGKLIVTYLTGLLPRRSK